MLPGLVCFDAGFTLIRPRQTMVERLAAVLETHGHPADQEDLRRAWEAADGWFWDTYHQPGNSAWTEDSQIEATWRGYHRLMIEHVGVADTEQRLLEAALASQHSASAWEPYPDTVAALELVRRHPSRAGLAPARIAVISDWQSTLGGVLEALGLADAIDVLAVSAIEGVAKPEPAFFHRACERAGVAAGDAVMIGDSYRADVLGARSAGMGAVLLDRNGTARETDVPIAGTLPDAVELASSLHAARR